MPWGKLSATTFLQVQNSGSGPSLFLAMHLTLQKAPLKGNFKDEFCCYYPGRGWGRAAPGPGAGVPEAEGGGDDQPAHCDVSVTGHLDT